MGRQSHRVDHVDGWEPRQVKVYRELFACWSVIHTQQVLDWCGAIPAKDYVSIILWGPDEGVTPFPWSDGPNNFLGLVSVI